MFALQSRCRRYFRHYGSALINPGSIFLSGLYISFVSHRQTGRRGRIASGDLFGHQTDDKEQDGEYDEHLRDRTVTAVEQKIL